MIFELPVFGQKNATLPASSSHHRGIADALVSAVQPELPKNNMTKLLTSKVQGRAAKFHVDRLSIKVMPKFDKMYLDCATPERRASDNLSSNDRINSEFRLIGTEIFHPSRSSLQ